MDIGIFLEYEGEVVQIPVNPETFNVRVGGNNEVTEIISLGDIVIPKNKRLAEIEWESFFPYESWHPAVRTKGEFESAQFYLDFINKIRDDCKPCHLSVTGIGFDEDVVIEDFKYYHQAGDHEDTYYSISLKQYRHHRVSIIAKDVATTDKSKATDTTAVGTTPPKSAAPIQPKDITIGCDVILNGRVHYDSYGSKPGKTFTNYKGKVNLINKKGTHPYHVTTPSGGWLGWVTEGSVKLA